MHHMVTGAYWTFILTPMDGTTMSSRRVRRPPGPSLSFLPFVCADLAPHPFFLCHHTLCLSSTPFPLPDCSLAKHGRTHSPDCSRGPSRVPGAGAVAILGCAAPALDHRAFQRSSSLVYKGARAIHHAATVDDSRALDYSHYYPDSHV